MTDDNVIHIGRRQGAEPPSPNPDMQARREAKRREGLAHAAKELRAGMRDLNRMLREHADGIDLLGVMSLLELSGHIDRVLDRHADTCAACRAADAT